MSRVALLDLDHANEWRSHLDEFPVHLQDIYFTPQYYALHEANEEGSAFLFTYRSGEDLWVMPFLRRAVDRVGAVPVLFDCADTETAYGYGGPLSTTNRSGFLRAAWEAYDEFCRESHIVTDFIRFHPLLGNHCHLESFKPEAVRPIRNYVWVDLEQSPEELWTRSYSSKNRQNIRRALNHGVHVRQAATGEDYRAFVALYLSTMSRLSAGSYYFFSEPYFAALARLVADHGHMVALCVAEQAAQLPGLAILRLQLFRDHQFGTGGRPFLDQDLRGAPGPDQRAGQDDVQLHAALVQGLGQLPGLRFALGAQGTVLVILNPLLPQGQGLPMTDQIYLHGCIPCGFV